MDRKQFFDMCVRGFGFLQTDFGFMVVSQDSSSVSFSLSLKNATTGVRILYEFRECYVFVQICRLVNDKIVPVSGELRPDTVLHCYDLDDLVALRSSGSRTLSYQPNTAFEGVILRQARNLRQYAEDVLRGDFSVFEELDKVVKEWSREVAFKKWGEQARRFGWQ